MKKQTRVGFVGGGNMAEALIKGMIGGKILKPSDCRVYDVLPERMAHLQQTYDVAAETEIGPVVKASEVVILAVKPQQVPRSLESVIPYWTAEKLLVSIAAGITLETLAAPFSRPPRIVRVMPNTPALALAGISALCKNEAAAGDDLQRAANLFKAVGETVFLEEGYFDAVTGLSGSGPAYVFVILDALADAGVKVGLPRNIAATLALETVYGASRLARQTDRGFSQLKEMVTSPGGTTIAGLHVMERAGLRGILMDAVEAATQRSKELSTPKPE